MDVIGSHGKLQMRYIYSIVTLHFYWGVIQLNTITGEILSSGHTPNIPKNKNAIMNEYYVRFIEALQEQFYVCFPYEINKLAI